MTHDVGEQEVVVEFRVRSLFAGCFRVADSNQEKFPFLYSNFKLAVDRCHASFSHHSIAYPILISLM